MFFRRRNNYQLQQQDDNTTITKESRSLAHFKILFWFVFGFLALLALFLYAILRPLPMGSSVAELNQTAVFQTLLDAFARTVTEQDWHGNANLFVAGGTSAADFHRAMTFLSGGPDLVVDGNPVIAPVGSWRHQLEVFGGGLSSNHLMLTNCNMSFWQPPLANPMRATATCIASYTYTLAYAISLNTSMLPTQLVAFQAQFEAQKGPFATSPHFAGWQLTHALALPNATSTLLSTVDTGVAPPGAVLRKSKVRDLSDPLVVWTTLQDQLVSLISLNQLSTAIAVCKTDQYLSLASLFDPYGNNTLCQDLESLPVYLETPMICSGVGRIDPSCVSAGDPLFDRIRTINSITPIPSIPVGPGNLDFTITAGFGLAIQGNTHGITIHNVGLVSLELFASFPFYFTKVLNFIAPSVTLELNDTIANTVWAGPISGPDAQPNFRALVLADLPLIDLATHVTGVLPLGNGGTGNGGLYSGGRIIVSNPGGTQLIETGALGDGYFLVQDVGGALVPGTIEAGVGINITFSGGIFTITNLETITVVQVDLEVPTDIFQVTSVPIIDNGTLTFVVLPQVAHSVWIGPLAGGPAVPSFRLLQESDLPVISLTGIKLSGILPVARGGTNSDGTTWVGERIIMSATGGTALTEGTVTGEGGISVTLGPGPALTISGTGGVCSNTTIDQSCLDISTLTCPGGSLGASCIPSTLTLAALTVTGPASLGTSTTCAAPLSAPCYDISGQSCPGGYLNTNCINPDLTLNTLMVNSITANEITLLNGTITVEGLSNFESINTTTLYVNDIQLFGSMTCSPQDTISQNCYDISGITCMAPISSNCFPINITVADASVTNLLEVNNVVCLGGTLGSDCIPPRIRSINGIFPSATPTLGFAITAGTGISVTPAVNGIVVANTGVTSVGLSLPLSLFSITVPSVTTTGTLTAVLQSQGANTFFAAPDGTAGTPSFRAIEFTDLPLGPGGPNSLYYVDGTGNLTSAPLSLALAAPVAEFSVSGSPITAPTGTFTLTKATQVAHSIWIGPNGGPAAQPTFRTLVLPDLSPLGLTNGQVLTGVTAGAPVGKTLVAGMNMIITEMAGSFVFDSTSVDFISNVSMTVPSYLSVSPMTLTSSGTFSITSNTQSARTFLAGPTTGPATDPAFRTITYGDLPALADGQFYIGSTGLAPMANQLTAGTLITITPGPGTSTVSSTALGTVTLNMPTAVFDVASVSAVNSLTLTVTFDTQAPNTFFAGPTSGGAATPTFRPLVTADLPTAILLSYNEVTSTTPIMMFSTAMYTVVTSMTLTPGAGTYWCSFSTSVIPTTSSGSYDIALFSNGVIIAHSARHATGASAYYNMHTLAVITTPGGQPIDVRWQKNSGSGTADMFERSLYCLRIG